MTMTKSRWTLRKRITAFYAVLLVIVLGAFGGTVYAIIENEEEEESPEVAALEAPEETGKTLLIALGAAVLVAAPLAGVGAWVIAKRGLAPLDDVVTTAGRINAAHLDERIPLRDEAPDEIARLVTAVNGMLERLEVSVHGMRRFTADASHELRTPLASLMGELELALRHPRDEHALREVISDSLESLARLAQLMDSLLALAQSDGRALPMSNRSFDLSSLMQRVGEPYEAELGARAIVLSRMIASDVHAHADPLLVARVVANLLDNACKFAPSGGTVELVVSTDHRRAVVEVRDSGLGISSSDRGRIFERFFRSDDARAHTRGFGLGLALAREMARAMGGELELLDATGARFRLSLTATTAPAPPAA